MLCAYDLLRNAYTGVAAERMRLRIDDENYIEIVADGKRIQIVGSRPFHIRPHSSNRVSVSLGEWIEK